MKVDLVDWVYQITTGMVMLYKLNCPTGAVRLWKFSWSRQCLWFFARGRS